MLEHEVQHACAEGVARAGGLDHAAAAAGGDEDAAAAVVGVAAGGPGGDVEDADVGETAAQDGGALVKVGLAGHKLQLVVRDLQNVAALKAPFNGGPGVRLALPERGAQVRVKGDQRPGLFGQGIRLLGRGAAGLVREGEGAEVEDAAAAQQRLIELVGAQQNVRPGLAVKAEIPVAVCEGVHHGKRRGDLRIPLETPGVDPGLPHGLLQHVAEAVLAHLAHKGAALAQLAQHGQYVRRRAAGVCLEEKVALIAQTVLGEVHQQFAQGDHVKALVVHRSSPQTSINVPFQNRRSARQSRRAAGGRRSCPRLRPL